MVRQSRDYATVISGRTLRLILAIVVATGFLWLLLREVRLAALAEVISSAQREWLWLALSALLVGYAARISRWQRMLRLENAHVGWQGCAGPFLASFATNNVLPFRAGDVLRCVAFSQHLGVSVGGAAATLLIERVLDVLMLLLFLGAGLLFFDLPASRFFAVGGAAFSVIALAVLAMLVFPQVLGWAASVVSRLMGRLLPNFAQRISAEFDRTQQLFERLAQARLLLPLVGWSALAWSAEGLMFFCVAQSLSVVEQPLLAWLALPVATLATVLPGTPGYVGTFDFFAAEAMLAGGNAMLASTAFALLVHIVLWLPVTVAGGLWLWLRRS